MALPETLVGAGVLALGILVGVDTALSAGGPAYAQVGPAAFPFGAAAALVALGIALLAKGARGGWRDPAGEAALGRANLRALAWAAGGLALNAALIPYIGFILASTALFFCVARAFDSRKPLRDLGVGFALAFVAFVGFSKLLGIRLGSGPIESLF